MAIRREEEEGGAYNEDRFMESHARSVTLYPQRVTPRVSVSRSHTTTVPNERRIFVHTILARHLPALCTACMQKRIAR